MDERVLDTNIVSYWFNQHTLFDLYAPLILNKKLSISFMTLAEMLEGAKRAKWGERRQGELEALFKRLVVIETNRQICDIWAEVRYGRRRQPIEQADAWIAATALYAGLPLITHNVRDFANIPKLELITAY